MFDQLVEFFEGAGYAGIIALMFLENLFPPIPSEVIMPLAGFQAAKGETHLALVIASGTLGSVLGAIFWFHPVHDHRQRPVDRPARLRRLLAGERI